MRLVNSEYVGIETVYDIEVADVHNFYANGVNVHNCTGLPYNTIAVAANGGVSVIREEFGDVVDITTTNSDYNKVVNVAFRDDNKISHLWSYTSNTTAARYITVTDIPSADYSIGNSVTDSAEKLAFYADSLVSPDLVVIIDRTLPSTIQSDNGLFFGQSGGLTHLKENTTTPSEGMVAYTTSNYATGYMHGDIKGAFLCDAEGTTENVTGGELVTNGTFDTDTSGWTAEDANVSIATVSGEMEVTTTAGYKDAYQNLTLVSGKKYVASGQLRAGTASALVEIRSNGVANGNTGAITSGTLQDFSISFVAGSSSNSITLQVQDESGGTAYFDNISVRLAEPDRSVNGNGLQVFGTVTKNPVATGADLVAYSGFSTSNYLEQPYNSDLDFGTGDFCVMGWVKDTGVTTVDTLFERSAAGSNVLKVDVESNGYIRFDSGTQITGTKNIANSNWNFVACVRVSGVSYIYVNGTLDNSGASTGNVTNTSAVSRLGLRVTGINAATNASLALWRISATAPSAEQIKKIYEDEKVLFQENAQATLYGSSDSVTALAYDDDTELLHVGTSAGRSVFQGLRRVDNTTDAVGAAISASGGMVADD
jgi:hypothetical protein